MKRVWVIGAGGMLGGAIRRELCRGRFKVYHYHEPFDWTSPDRVRKQFNQSVLEFLAGLSIGDSWEIFWAAGVGTMGSKREELDIETTALIVLLAALDQCLPNCPAHGVIGFASSAGALYAGCRDFEITEETPVVVVNDYAAAKLRQEKILETFVYKWETIRVLIARFSTLYGPGQMQGKRQGLLTHIARCILRHQLVEIFVPLDTSRDYVFIDDAARDFIYSSRVVQANSERIRFKIIAAECSVTISEIVATFNRLNKRRVRLICNRNNLSGMYASRVAYRSILPRTPESEGYRHTLLEGVAAIIRHERMSYIEGNNRG